MTLNPKLSVLKDTFFSYDIEIVKRDLSPKFIHIQIRIDFIGLISHPGVVRQRVCYMYTWVFVSDDP